MVRHIEIVPKAGTVCPLSTAAQEAVENLLQQYSHTGRRIQLTKPSHDDEGNGVRVWSIATVTATDSTGATFYLESVIFYYRVESSQVGKGGHK